MVFKSGFFWLLWHLRFRKNPDTVNHAKDLMGCRSLLYSQRDVSLFTSTVQNAIGALERCVPGLAHGAGASQRLCAALGELVGAPRLAPLPLQGVLWPPRRPRSGAGNRRGAEGARGRRGGALGGRSLSPIPWLSACVAG